jgi:hypothetical protein
MTTSPCRYCGKKIVWASGLNGKSIPLDPTPAVYSVQQDADGHYRTMNGAPVVTLRDRFADNLPTAMVSHFTTCPKASQASQDAAARRGPEGVVPDSRDTQA